MRVGLVPDAAVMFRDRYLATGPVAIREEPVAVWTALARTTKALVPSGEAFTWNVKLGPVPPRIQKIDSGYPKLYPSNSTTFEPVPVKVPNPSVFMVAILLLPN